jgi:hypothetical protein
MKKIITRLLLAVGGVAVILGAFVCGFKSGWRHGCVETAALEGVMAMRAGEALATNDYTRASKLIGVMIGDVEAQMIAFENTIALPGVRYEQAETMLRLDAYRQRHPRLIPFGVRVDEKDTKKYGIAGGYAINAGRDSYERAYSNAVAKAKARLGK